MPNRWLCIHGHFYQPPRENPWLEAIELQDSASPYHDWNRRITAECFAPNARARILDERGRIVTLVNNYSKMSFNFGPTLMSWLEDQAPEVYEAILRADSESLKRFSGHGSALAQAYNHSILPLGSSRHCRIQVHWGIRDFEKRFGRKPEGFWLPETAVNLQVLEILSEAGIRFTILAPHQAARWRRKGERDWKKASANQFDTTRPYECRLPSGRSIVLFFYNGPISRAIAFEGLLNNGESLARRLLDSVSGSSPKPQLIHVATDGETYGHHHRFGEMALAYALQTIEREGSARLTNYGEFLELNLPQDEVEIVENTSWSCAHGVERWRSDCGCNTGAHPTWNQKWRGPLRFSLSWLESELNSLFERAAGSLFKDPWKAVDSYIRVLLDRSVETQDSFLDQHCRRPLQAAERVRALKLLEMQRHSMLMFTSCGWFFDDISGIESVQILQYAGRALQLAKETDGHDLEASFQRRLRLARSNRAEYGNGHKVYQRFVAPFKIDLHQVAAHFALGALFQTQCEETEVFCYRVKCVDFKRFESDGLRLAIGISHVSSTVTREEETLRFGALQYAEAQITGGLSRFLGEAEYAESADRIRTVLQSREAANVVKAFEREFEMATYSLKQVFRDRQRTILGHLLRPALKRAESAYREVYEANQPLISTLEELKIPLPQAFDLAARFLLTIRLRRVLEEIEPNSKEIGPLIDQARRQGVDLDSPWLRVSVQRLVRRLADRLRSGLDEPATFESLGEIVKALQKLPFPVDFWSLQNNYFDAAHEHYPKKRQNASKGDRASAYWIRHFAPLSQVLAVALPEPETEAPPKHSN